MSTNYYFVCDNCRTRDEAVTLSGAVSVVRVEPTPAALAEILAAHENCASFRVVPEWRAELLGPTPIDPLDGVKGRWAAAEVPAEAPAPTPAS